MTAKNISKHHYHKIWDILLQKILKIMYSILLNVYFILFVIVWTIKIHFLGFFSPIKIPTHFAWVDNVQTITYALCIIIICYPVNFSIYQINSGSSHLWVDKSNSMVALRISVFWFVLTEVKYLAEGNK